MQIEDWQWREEQKRVFYNNMQAQYDKELDAIKQKLIQDLKTKDKGTMRNINNYRMKLWSEVLIEVIKNNQTKPTPTEVADKALQEFDKRFNPITND